MPCLKKMLSFHWCSSFYSGWILQKEWLHILEKGLLAWIAMLHRKTSEKHRRPFPPFVYYHFHFSLCQTKNWIKALFFTERDFLSSRSNLLYKVTREEEHIHPPPRVPSQISLVSISLCKHRGLGGVEKKKSIRAYLNEEGQDTMAPSESWVVIKEVDEVSSPSTRSPVDKTRLWTPAGADTAARGNEREDGTAVAINLPISHQHCSH